ncbi:hypothetical protein IID22_05375 [Patescibacteria group bacterium]|nr:hypothetical protein [Patescibacteria group bacterium]
MFRSGENRLAPAINCPVRRAKKAKNKILSSSAEDIERKKEEKEKAKAGEEAGKKMKKAAAKTAKHQTGEKVKQPKHPQRKALAK